MQFARYTICVHFALISRNCQGPRANWVVKKEEGIQRTAILKYAVGWAGLRILCWSQPERTASVPFPPHLTFISSVMEPTETRNICDVDKKVGNLRRNKISVVSHGSVDVEMHDYMPSPSVTKVRKN